MNYEPNVAWSWWLVIFDFTLFLHQRNFMYHFTLCINGCTYLCCPQNSSVDIVRLLDCCSVELLHMLSVESYVPSIRMIAISGLCHPDQVASYAGIVAWTLGVWCPSHSLVCWKLRRLLVHSTSVDWTLSGFLPCPMLQCEEGWWEEVKVKEWSSRW